jgi:hypothetical protein
VRIASWLFVVCVAIGAAGIFVPSVELHAGEIGFGRRGALSLYQANTNREFIRKAFATYHASTHKKVAEAMLAAMMPRVGGKLHGHLDDAHSALTGADDVGDDDIRTATIALAITIWAFLGFQAAMAALVLRELMRDTFRKRPLVIAAAMAIVVAVVAVAIHVIVREAVWEANDDLGKDVVAVAFGAYMMLVAAIGAVGAIGFLLFRAFRLQSTRGPAR